MAQIYKLSADGVLSKVAEYSLSAREALVAYIMQYVRGNYHTWNYPDHIDGMRRSNLTYAWYYDVIDGMNSYVLASYPA